MAKSRKKKRVWCPSCLDAVTPMAKSCDSPGSSSLGSPVRCGRVLSWSDACEARAHMGEAREAREARAVRVVLGPRTSQARAAQCPAPRLCFPEPPPATPPPVPLPPVPPPGGSPGALHPQPWPRTQTGWCPVWGCVGVPHVSAAMADLKLPPRGPGAPLLLPHPAAPAAFQAPPNGCGRVVSGPNT